MGGRVSRGWNKGQSSSSRVTPSASYPQENTSYDPPPQAVYTPLQQYDLPPQTHGGQPQQPKRSRLSRIADLLAPSSVADNYPSLEEVTEALSRAGLESSNLIVGIDFNKSNEWTGAKSYDKGSLHHIGYSLNPYEQAISIIGKTLAAFDVDNLIPCYGFGDESTKDQEVFSFYQDERFCNGFKEVLNRYREIVPQLRLAGPTSFAPVIEMAMTIVEQSDGKHHVLVIIADGQVTRSVDTEDGQLSPQERTVEAIVQASKFPLSIILIGVGDGPWDMMKKFEDNIPARAFDNFQFVNFTEIMSKNVPHFRKEIDFALAALMKIPSQYKATSELNILGGRKGNAPERVPLPPPMYGAASSSGSKPSRTPSFPPSSPESYNQGSSAGTAPPITSSTSVNQVTNALARAVLKSSHFIVGIDFTKSNEWTGAKSNNKRSLHDIGDSLNPYEQAIHIIGNALAADDDDNLIPCFGFGDESTKDQEVFSFYQDERFCNGFKEVLKRYKEIVPQLRLAGPTSFAPVIEMAMTIVEQSGGKYHVLAIIADGQVTRSVDNEDGQLSPQERRTVEAIAQASFSPLSIILVGVGDMPWDMMKEFVDNIPVRAFDNFLFVNFTGIMSKNMPDSQKEKEFADAALKEIPSHYKATLKLNNLGGRKGNAPERVPLPPPMYGAAYSSGSEPSRAPSFLQSSPSFPPSSPDSYGQGSSAGTAPPITSSTFDNQVCPICLSNPKDMAFGCGHQTCCDCGQHIRSCPICRSPIRTRIELKILGGWKGNAPERVPLPPPMYGAAYSSGSKPSHGPSFWQSSPSFPLSTPDSYGQGSSAGTAPPVTSSTFDNQVCPICHSNPMDMAFGCGHQTCCDCGQDLHACPICRSPIQTRIKLY